jgi:Brp/Blh family beta-carotene 15,15'-monooxygenase
MITKKLLVADRIRRIDGGFSFIPHRFLTDGFLQTLSQPQLLLYIFLVLAAFFCILPALLAFGVYFSFLHSIRHMLRLSGNPETGSALLAVAGLIRLALPVTAATLALGGSAYLLLSGVSFEMPDLIRVIFIGIVSMTYPHALVVSLAEHAGAIQSQRNVAVKLKMKLKR